MAQNRDVLLQRESEPAYTRADFTAVRAWLSKLSVSQISSLYFDEERLEVLEARIRELGLPMENYWWYLDTRRFGSVPHAGFGLGFERLVMLVTGIGNIRDVTPFARTWRHLEF